MSVDTGGSRVERWLDNQPGGRALKPLKFDFYSWDWGAIDGLGSPVFPMMTFMFSAMKLSFHSKGRGFPLTF